MRKACSAALRPDRIFRDGFESGDLSAWSGARPTGATSRLHRRGPRLHQAGLQGVVDDTAGLFVQDDRPADENRYRARFFLDPN